MRIVHASFLRPPHHSDPDWLLEEWPTLLDVAAAVVNAGADVSLVQTFAKDAIIERRGVTCRFVKEPPLPGSWSGLAPWRTAHAAAGTGPDVIHVNGLDFPFHTRAMCKTGVPVLAQDHASRHGRRRLQRRWGLAQVAGVAFTEVEQAEPFIAEGTVASGARVFSVPESSSHFSPGDQARARSTTRVFGDPALLWVGRLDENKDPLTILDALELAAEDLPDARLWCCYHEQPLLDRVKAKVAGSPVLRDRVHLLGKVPHETIEQLCRAADFFVAASHREGSGYALIEALACGTTPIVSDIPAFRRLAGDVGFLVPVGDATGFAAAITAAARQTQPQLRAKAISHFKANLSFEAVGRQLCEIYATLAAPV